MLQEGQIDKYAEHYMNHSKLNLNFIHLKYPHYMSMFMCVLLGVILSAFVLSVDQETQMRLHLRLFINCTVVKTHLLCKVRPQLLSPSPRRPWAGQRGF
jgi:uncharacterized membrane protein